MFQVNPNVDSTRDRSTRPDPERELRDYMKTHNCTREDAIKALEAMHGRRRTEKPGMRNGNVDMTNHSKDNQQMRPDPKTVYEACKLEHPEWSDAQIKSYLEKMYGKPKEK